MATMKENKGKEVMDEAIRQWVQSQPHPSIGDKRKNLSKAVDSVNLPSRHKEKRAKHRSSLLGVVKPSVPVLPTQRPSVQIHDVNLELRDPSSMNTPSIANVLASSQPSRRVPQNLLENEDLAWERFEKVVTDQDVVACYDMSLKEFEHSGVHDLFKAMSKFITASRQATEMDKTRILLETRI